MTCPSESRVSRRIVRAFALTLSALLVGGIVVLWNRLQPDYGLSVAELRSLASDEQAQLSILVETFGGCTRERWLQLIGTELIVYPSMERLTLDPGTRVWRDEDGRSISTDVFRDKTGVSSPQIIRATTICRELRLSSVACSRDSSTHQCVLVASTGGLLGWGDRGLIHSPRVARVDDGCSYTETESPGWRTFERVSE